MANAEPPLSTTRENRIQVRGRDLAGELIGNLSFTEMLLLDLHGEPQSPAHVRVVDAVLVVMMEHGITPSTLAARLVLDGAPESMQGAVAAGLLAAGSRFLGAIEEAARLLQAVVAGGGSRLDSARSHVRELLAAGSPIPGFGHNLHVGDDPRVAALFGVVRAEGVAGDHVACVEPVREAISLETGRALIPNAAVAVAAVLSDLGYTADVVRGFSLVARCAGLFAHVVDERRRPMARQVWQEAHERVSGS